MIFPPAKKIYLEILNFCKEAGLLEKLKKSLSVSESLRFDKLKISKDGLGLLDAVHCLIDTKRTNIFLQEIDSYVDAKSIVLEAGIGTGIFSFYCANKGATVYGLEINPDIFKFAMDLREHLHLKMLIDRKKVNFLCTDAIKFSSNLKFDIVISENLYTGMFYEKQVQILNNFTNFFKNRSTIIPKCLKSSLYLCNTSFTSSINKKQMFVRSELAKNERIVFLSSKNQYDCLNFEKKNKTRFKFEKYIHIKEDGQINSVLICSDVIMPSGIKITRRDTTFLNNDIVVGLEKNTSVRKGDVVRLNISYTYGSKPKDLQLDINVVTNVSVYGKITYN